MHLSPGKWGQGFPQDQAPRGPPISQGDCTSQPRCSPCGQKKASVSSQRPARVHVPGGMWQTKAAIVTKVQILGCGDESLSKCREDL